MNLEDFPRFYAPNCAAGQSLDLPEEEARHARVLRVADGDEVRVLDGRGGFFSATVTSTKKKLRLALGEKLLQRDPESNLTLAIAPTKNTARIEMVVEKATEIGIARIVPIQCEQSERTRLNRDRMEKIAVSAMKQSEGLWLPEITELQNFSFILNIEAQGWMAHCEEDDSKTTLGFLSAAEGHQLVAIGPEGDFSPAEISAAREGGFHMLDLGSKRLRTETAALVVCLAMVMKP